MKKRSVLFFVAIAICAVVAGCSSKKDSGKKYSYEGSVECDWFADSTIDKSYMVENISFSKDDETAMLSYSNRTMGAKLSDMYRVYISKKQDDKYSGLKKVEFDKEYYPITATICDDGNEVIFTGLLSEEAKTREGFANGCKLYIGDFDGEKVSNIRELKLEEDNCRYFVLSVLDDNSFIFNRMDLETGKMTLKYAKYQGGKYEVSEITDKKLDEYYWKTMYVVNGKAFMWRADESTHSFDALISEFDDGSVSEVSSLSPEFMYNKDYADFYKAVGYDHNGGVYVYEKNHLENNSGIIMYRNQIDYISFDRVK